MSKRYTLPASDIEVTCEYAIYRNQDVVLGDCYIDDQTLPVDKIYVPRDLVDPDRPFRKEGEYMTLQAYFQMRLDFDANEILGWEYEEAAE